jgi:hypothetical protein
MTKPLSAKDYSELKKTPVKDWRFSQSYRLFMFRFVETKITNNQNDEPNWTHH